jgi:hypothetical protein
VLRVLFAPNRPSSHNRKPSLIARRKALLAESMEIGGIRAMKRMSIAIVLILIVSTMGFASSASGGPSNRRPTGLEMYSATLDAKTFQRLHEQGYDVTMVDQSADAVEAALVLSSAERNKLDRQGIDLRVWRDGLGRTQSELAARQAQNGFNVWRPYDGPDGIAAELRSIAAQHPKLAQLHVLGTTHQGREILAIRLTHRANRVPLGRRPAVLYQGTTHAREWISTEVTRRLLHWYIDTATNPDVRRLLRRTELWFIPVVNPDGYQYTFDVERLWRKNLRDNNGNGVIDGADGVDLNRNYPEHWGYDEEGSSSNPSSETYRGPAPASEPETKADMSVFDKAKFRFAISYHSFGQLLLYPQGWQVQTPSADDPIYVALTGIDEQPAVEGFDPDLGAELYITNGEFTDWAHAARDALAWTPELSEGCEGCGFVFPDDEALVQQEFEKNLDFAVRVAASARDPDDPVSHWGIDTAPLYTDVSDVDPYKSNNPLSDLTFDVSYAGGTSQPVEVLAKRDLGRVTLHYSINGGPAQRTPTAPSPPGERYGGNNDYNVYYHYLRGDIPGLKVGDSVEYWFSSPSYKTPHSTFDVLEDADAEVLIVSQEDYTGASNDPPYVDTTAPNYLSYYTSALEANGVSFDVYDVDAMGRQAPSQTGVLDHYGAVIWYRANDVVTREPGWEAGNVSRLANDLMLEHRHYLNFGGKLLYTGQWAGALENGVAGAQFYDPVANEQCVVEGELVLARCLLMSDKNDFLQYYLGAYTYNSDAGTDPATGEPLPVDGIDDPYNGLSWDFNGADSAANQIHTASFLTTSSILPPDQYPQFTSDAPAVWRGAADAFEPFDGEWYVYSGQADVSYKRLMRTIDLTSVDPSDAPTLSFRFSYDTEPDWDFVFVEAHTVGQDDWTTLPDLNGHTSQSTGESCAAGWFELHPWLERYQGADCSGSNPETGGEWHASSGRSAGWEEWTVDLSAYAGQQVEVSISYASDWAVQGLGAFVDAIEVSTGEGSTSFEEDDDPMDGWVVPGPPEGSADNPNDWTRTQSVGFEEGAVTKTEDTLYFGFGFEGISGAETRAEVMNRSLSHLLP